MFFFHVLKTNKKTHLTFILIARANLKKGGQDKDPGGRQT